MTETLATATDPPARDSRRGARLEADRVSRRFGPHQVLEDVSLRIEPGTAFGLLGSNGAGKTTFIRLVTGRLLPSAGTLLVDGLCPGDDPGSVQSRIGYVPESPRVYPELRVESFLRFVAGLHGLAGGDKRAAVEGALERFGLEPVARRRIGNLSKGYQQRVSLAQAFLHEPSLLVIDEPTAGLDPLQRREVQQWLRECTEKQTILLCTHDLEEARVLTSRIAVLHRGRLVTQGDTESILGETDPLEFFGPQKPAGGAPK